MSEEELVEVLAKRLYSLPDPAGPPPGYNLVPWGELELIELKVWRGLARECLRQMRYARLCGCLEASECEYHNRSHPVSYKSFGPFDVAIAPEGWEAK